MARDKKELAAAIQTHVDRALAQPPRVPQPPFDPRASRLGYWLPEVARAGIAHVPAERVGDAPVGQLRHAMWEPETPAPDVRALLLKATEMQVPGMMFRWDVCAPLDLKIRMGRATDGTCPTAADVAWLMLDDPRMDDILGDLFAFDSTEPLAFWRRPWQQVTMEAGYPVEFRAFVLDHKLQGVCSYYPQRPLPAHYLPDMEKVRDLTVKLQESCGMDSFTADWLLTPEGELLWLEGGPPHLPHCGAHPCCFRPGHIDGFLLAPVDSALTE